jgi:O-antigen/teichoic acid export membrane protein
MKIKKNDINELQLMQKKVINLTLLLLLFSLFFAFLFFSRDIVLSVCLGAAISLYLFNSKMKKIREVFRGKNKFIAGITLQSILNYLLLFIILIVVKSQTNLNVWVVLTYSFLTNFLLILTGVFSYPKKIRG